MGFIIFQEWTLLDYAWLVTRMIDERRIINPPIEEEELEEDDIPNEVKIFNICNSCLALMTYY